MIFFQSYYGVFVSHFVAISAVRFMEMASYSVQPMHWIRRRPKQRQLETH